MLGLELALRTEKFWVKRGNTVEKIKEEALVRERDKGVARGRLRMAGLAVVGGDVENHSLRGEIEEGDDKE